jgi:small GTP-binding protein
MVSDAFLDTADPTTASAYSEYDPPNHPDVRLQLWDTSGMEKYRAINSIYYREACAALLTFDIADRQSFDSSELWLGDFEKSNAMTNPAVFLVGNKCDLIDSAAVDEELARSWADEHRLSYFSVSARTGEGMAELLDALVRSVPKFLSASEPAQSIVAIPTQDVPGEEKKCC